MCSSLLSEKAINLLLLSLKLWFFQECNECKLGIQLTTPTFYLNGDFLILMRVIIHLNVMSEFQQVQELLSFLSMTGREITSVISAISFGGNDTDSSLQRYKLCAIMWLWYNHVTRFDLDVGHKILIHFVSSGNVSFSYPQKGNTLYTSKSVCGNT